MENLVEPEASSRSQFRAILDELESCVQCPICFDVLKDPRNLRCKHTFCLRCLHNLIRSRPSTGLICPFCKNETPVPADSDLELLERNKDLEGVVNVYHKLNKLYESGANVAPHTISSDQNQNESSSSENKLGVPFRISKNQALNRFREWLPHLENSPLDLPSSATNIQIEQIFCPVYEFAITANTTYSVKIHLLNGATSPSMTGDHGSDYTVVVYASEELPEVFRKVLESSKIDLLQDDDLSDFIYSGAKVLPRTISRDSAQISSESQTHNLEREACRVSALDRYARHGAYAISDLISSTTIQRCYATERLLPVYTGSYQYQEKNKEMKTFRFIVSGITGDVYGEYPSSPVLSRMKANEGLIKFVLTVIGLLLVIWFLSIRQKELSRGYFY